jgi:hypothetical protein
MAHPLTLAFVILLFSISTAEPVFRGFSVLVLPRIGFWLLSCLQEHGPSEHAA